MITPLLLAVGILAAEPKDTTLPAPVELESITITSTHSASMHRASSELILPMAELARFNISDGNTLLQSQPGVYTQQEDGWGLRLNIGIRGTGVERSSRITLMEDGILTAPAAYSAPAAYYSPVLWKYEHIEILKGGAALITGPQSTGGAVNFVTATPQKDDYLNLRTHAGAFGQLLASVQGQETLSKRAQVLFGFQNNRADGFNDILGSTYGGFNLADGYIKWIQHLDAKDRHHLEFFVGATQERSNQTYLGLSLEDAINAPNTRYLASALDQMAMERLMTRVGYTLNMKKGWVRADVYRQYVHRNWYKLDKIIDSTGSVSIANLLRDPALYAPHFLALQGLQSGDFQASLKANNRTYLSEGVQFRGQHSDRLKAIYIKTEGGARFHYDHADRFQHADLYVLSDALPALISEGTPGSAGNRIDAARAASAYARTTLSWNTWNVQVGVRGEYISSMRKDWGRYDEFRSGISLSERANTTATLLPGISVSKAMGNWRLFTGVHQGMTPAGSKDGVLPELSINTELGVQHTKVPVSLTLYHSVYDRLLGSDAASSGGSGTGELYNGGSAEISGIEGQWGISRGAWELQTSGTYTRAIFTESFNSEFEGWGKVEAGDVLPYLPAFQGNISAVYSHQRWSTALQAQGLSARKSSAELDQYDLPSSLVFNYAVDYKVNEVLQIKAGVQNLTNTRHIVAARPAGFRTFTPRMWTLGMSLSL